MSARPWTTGSGAGAEREVKLADWFVPRTADRDVAALFAPQKPKPQASAKPKAAATAAPAASSPETKERLALLSSALEEIAEARRADRAQSVELIVEIALAVAEELAMGAVEAEPARLERLVGQSIGLMDTEQRMRVRLHPELIALFEASSALARLTQAPGVSVEADPSVGSRGCIVESAVQRVDGRMPARLERLRALLRAEEGVER
jgi:flagellar assembly protein FliH